MAKRRKPARPDPPAASVTAAPALRRRTWPRVDGWELATALFVLVATLLPGSPWYQHANGIVVTTVIFEFGMVWLMLFGHAASFAERRSSRIGLIALGAGLSAITGIHHATQLGHAGLILPGVCILAMRLRKPKEVALFDARHCRTITNEALAAWCTLIAVFLALLLLHVLSGGSGPAVIRQDQRFAIAWCVFYGTLALLMPVVRGYALHWKVPADGAGK